MHRRALRLAGWTAAALLTAVLLYTLLGFFVAPRLVERYLPEWITQRFGLVAKVGETTFNPFLLRFTANDVSLTERDEDQPFASVSRLQADLDGSTLTGRPLHLSRLVLEGLEILLERKPDGTLRVPALLPVASRPVQADRKRWHITETLINDSRLTVDVSEPGSPSRLSATLDATIHELGNHRDARGRYTLRAALPADARLSADGTLGLEPASSTGTFQIEGLAADAAWPFIRARLDMAPPEGRLDAEGRYRFGADSPTGALLLDALALSIEGFRLKRSLDATPMISARHMTVCHARLDIGERVLDLGETRLEDGSLEILNGPHGSNWSGLVVRDKKSDTEAESWQIGAQRFDLAAMALRYEQSGPHPLRVAIATMQGSGAIAVTTSTTPLQGRISDASLELSGVDAGAVEPDAGKGRGTDGFESFEHVSIKGGHLDASGRRVGAASVTAHGAALRVWRLPDGRFGSPLLLPAGSDAPRGVGRRGGDAPKVVGRVVSDAWRWGFGELVLEQSRIRYTDHTPKQPVTLALAPLQARFENLGELMPRPGRFRLRTGLPLQGHALLDGTLSLAPFESQARFELDGIELPVLWPLLRDRLALAEPIGRLALNGRYRMTPSKSGAAVILEGLSGELAGLTIAPPAAASPVLAARRLSWREGSVDFASQSVVIPRLLLSKARIASTAAGNTPASALPAAKASGWRVAIAALELDQVDVGYRHMAINGPVVLDVTAINGRARVALDSSRPQAGLSVSDAMLEASRLTIGRPGRSPPERLDNLTIIGGRIDSTLNRIGAASVSIKGGSVAIVRDAEGRLGSVALGPGNGLCPPGQKPWQFEFQSIQAERLGLRLTDRGFDPPIDYRARAQLRLSDIDRESPRPIAVQASMEILPGPEDPANGPAERRTGNGGTASVRGGTVQVRGSLAQDLASARADLAVERLDFSGLAPLLSRHVTLRLRSGSIDVAAKLAWQAGGRPSLKARGRFAIADLRLDEETSGERFLAWKRLATDAFDFSTDPNGLTIARINVDAPAARIQVSEKRELNLPSVRRRSVPPPSGQPNTTRRQAADAAAEHTGSERTPGANPLKVLVDRIDFRDGIVDFGDASLVLPFSTRVVAMRGSVLGISRARGDQATIHAEGRVAPFGEARIDGRVDTFSPRTLTDISVGIRNVSLPLLTPYTATFAGRTVRSGRLWLDLQYKISNGTLAGENRVVITELLLGERVATRDALDLPIDMAIALLTDEAGRIDLQIPVRGELGRPDFDYGALVRGAIASTLQRVVSAPFRFLGLLVGARQPGSLDGIAFEPGDERVMPQQQEQLAQLAVALTRRPAVQLQVRGVYDPERDAAALKERILRRLLIEATGAPAETGQPPGPVALEDHALRALAVHRSQRILEYMTGPQAIDADRIQAGEIVAVESHKGAIVAPLGLSATAR